MKNIVITETQFKNIKNQYIISPKTYGNKTSINEAWYNNVMDVVGIVDPTPITDTINAISYFSQGENLFGVLTLVAALPFYVGDIITKPVVGALKIGSKSAKELEMALKLAKTDSKAAGEIIGRLAKDPGPIGTFLQKAGGPTGWAEKVAGFLKEFPAGPFKGLRNTIMDYFTLLGRAGTKSKTFSGLAKTLEAELKAGKAGVKSIESLKTLLKTDKVFNVAALSKPGFMSQTFFGGLPRLFRSTEGRRIKMMMQQTKWWLGFLDYIGVGNWVGADEVVKQLGGEAQMTKSMEDYQKTPESKQYFGESFDNKEQPQPVSNTNNNKTTNNSSSEVQLDPFAKMLRNLLTGTLNPIPGV